MDSIMRKNSIQHQHWNSYVAPIVLKKSGRTINSTIKLLSQVYDQPEVVFSALSPLGVQISNLIASGMPWRDHSISMTAEEAFSRIMHYVRRHPDKFDPDLVRYVDKDLGGQLLLSKILEAYDGTRPVQNPIVLNGVVNIRSVVALLEAQSKNPAHHAALATFEALMSEIRKVGYDIVPDLTGKGLWCSVRIGQSPDIGTDSYDSIVDAAIGTADKIAALAKTKSSDPESFGPGM
jgi:hypothetical protein